MNDPEPADSDDLDLLADRRLKPTRFTVVLVILIGAALAFGGGVLVQKHYGTGSSGATGIQARVAGGFGPPAGGTGEFGGAGGFGGQAGNAQSGAAPGGTAQQAAGSTPVVVGSITKISGSVLTVKNFAGKSVKVTVPKGVTVTLIAGASLTALEPGSSISVAGTKNPDGSVKASAIRVTSK